MSRDGSQIAFISANFEEIWLMQTNDPGPHRIPTAKPDGGLAGLQWAPAGDRLAYARVYTGPKDAAGKAPRLIDLESIDLQGNNPVRMPFDPTDHRWHRAARRPLCLMPCAALRLRIGAKPRFGNGRWIRVSRNSAERPGCSRR